MDVFILNWFGPFTSREEIYDYDLLKYGIYAFFGTKKYVKNDNIILQYIGMTEKYFYDRLYDHHIVEKLKGNILYWFAIIKNKRVYELKDIEHCFIRFCNPNLNEKCVKALPEYKMVFISEFYKKSAIEYCNKKCDIDEDEKYNNLPHYMKFIPQFMMWDGNFLKLSQNIKTISREELCQNTQ